MLKLFDTVEIKVFPGTLKDKINDVAYQELMDSNQCKYLSHEFDEELYEPFATNCQDVVCKADIKRKVGLKDLKCPVCCSIIEWVCPIKAEYKAAKALRDNPLAQAGAKNEDDEIEIEINFDGVVFTKKSFLSQKVLDAKNEWVKSISKDKKANDFTFSYKNLTVSEDKKTLKEIGITTGSMIRVNWRNNGGNK